MSVFSALKNEQNLIAAYNGPLLWWHNYIGFGMPATWFGANQMPTYLIWPFISVFQRIVAAGALLFFVSSLGRLLPTAKPVLIVLATILCFLPFYQALHNAYLTESLSSSLLLIAAGIIVNVLRTGEWRSREILGLCATLFVLLQFRANIALMVCVTCAVLLFWVRNKAIVVLPSLALVMATGVSLFPAYRALYTHEFYLPRIGASAILAGTWVNPHPSKSAEIRLERFGLPQEHSAGKIVNEGIDYSGVDRIAPRWPVKFPHLWPPQIPPPIDRIAAL